MTQFKIGDRVRYTGKQEMLSPQLLGKTATVTAVASDGYVDGLEWDDQAEKHKSCFAGNLELIEDDRLTRLEAFVARVAEGGQMLALGHYEEAKALVAEIAPIDSDLIEARRIAACHNGGNPYMEEGQCDNDPLVKCAIESLARGRALERGEP